MYCHQCLLPGLALANGVLLDYKERELLCFPAFSWPFGNPLEPCIVAPEPASPSLDLPCFPTPVPNLPKRPHLSPLDVRCPDVRSCQVLIFFRELSYLTQSCNKQFRRLFFNHNAMSSEDQFLHVPSHFYVRCHPRAYSACCSATVLSLTERMLNSEPELAWDGSMNKSISRCALCFHFIKHKYHSGQSLLGRLLLWG